MSFIIEKAVEHLKELGKVENLLFSITQWTHSKFCLFIVEKLMRIEDAQFKEDDIENIDKVADFLEQLVINLGKIHILDNNCGFH